MMNLQSVHNRYRLLLIFRSCFSGYIPILCQSDSSIINSFVITIMINWQSIFISTAVCLSLPAVSIADVFHCPDSVELNMIKNEQGDYYDEWVGRLTELPAGMPSLFTNARFISTGEYNEAKSDYDTLKNSDFPLSLQFKSAVYEKNKMNEKLSYHCNYFSPGHKDLEVTLQLSENYLPGSDQLPLLVKTFGQDWRYDREENLRCKHSAEACSFAVPQLAARLRGLNLQDHTKKPPTPKVISLNGLKGDPETLEFVAATRWQYKFLDLEGLQATEHTHLNLYDMDVAVDIHEFIKSHSATPEDTQDCTLSSTDQVKCACSSENLIKSINSNGHTMLEIDTTFDRKFKAESASCALFNVPPSTSEHQPHDHTGTHHHHDGTEL